MSIPRPRIVALARAWIGTPYHHRASLRQVGCDCIGLVRGLWRELYGQEAETVGPYTGDWAEASGQELLLAGARRHLAPCPPALARPGDVLVFRLRPGTLAKHAAVLSEPDRMIHAQEGVPVAEVALAPWWRRRLAAAFSFPGAAD